MSSDGSGLAAYAAGKKRERDLVKCRGVPPNGVPRRVRITGNIRPSDARAHLLVGMVVSTIPKPANIKEESLPSGTVFLDISQVLNLLRKNRDPKHRDYADFLASRQKTCGAPGLAALKGKYEKVD